jgi:CBS domain-containing protein
MNEALERLLEQKGEALVTVSPRTSIMDAIARMNERSIGSLLVMEGDRLVGIFTERDVLTRVVPGNLDCHRTPVSEVMTRQLVTVTPATTVQEAMVVVTDTRRRHLPVLHQDRVVRRPDRLRPPRLIHASPTTSFRASSTAPTRPRRAPGRPAKSEQRGGCAAPRGIRRGHD